MIDTAEQRTSVWEYVNPINVAKFAYTSPLGSALYGPYKAMAKGKGLTFPGLIPWGSKGIDLKHAGTLWGTDGGFVTKLQGTVRSGARGMIFGVRGIGSGTTGEALEAMALSRRGLLGWKKTKANQIVKRTIYGEGWSSLSSGATSELKSVLGATSLWRTGGPGVAALGRAGIMMAGRVINPVMNLLLCAEIISFAAETTFKGIKATSDAINRASEKVYNLELGGELSRGFLSSGAATERQRALQAIQGSHLSGRRFLGSEATLAHG